MAANFTTTILVNQSPAKVFNAINNVRGWWQGEIKGESKKIDDEFEYRMNDIHYSRQKVVEIIPNEKVVWLVNDSNLTSFIDRAEWTGTKIIFEISLIGNKTQVHFTHVGLIPSFECHENCSWAWGQLIQESLFSFITTGKGINVFG